MGLDLKKASQAFWEDEYVATRIYRSIARRRKDKAQLFNELADMEARHGALWERVYREHSAGEKPNVDLWLRLKLLLSQVFLRLIGLPASIKYLELSESGAIRMYGILVDAPELQSHREEITGVILDEMHHEVVLLSEVIKAKGNVDDVRSATYGMVDSLVEVLAVVVGLAVVLVNPIVVALGGIITASAGTLSMSAGAYLSSKSQRDIVDGRVADLSVRVRVMPERQAERIGQRLREWGLPASVTTEVTSEMTKNHELEEALGKAVDLGLPEVDVENPLRAARSAGLYYFIGSLAPIAPFLVSIGGLVGIGLAIVFSLTLLSVASAIIAMLSGVSIKRKIFEMDTLSLAAALATFAIGFIARTVLGISV
jgi:VIT1/CCC1 family predicted Fe2+/Mn2+ transporter